jgi:hypothetical protein
MSFFSSMLGKHHKHDESETYVSSPQNTALNCIDSPKLHLRGQPDANGLYPSELIMLAVAERYKTTESSFPGYLSYTYEIANPAKMLRNLYSRGYLEIGSPRKMLSTFTIPKLKELSVALGISVKGKKADILSQFATVDDEVLSKFVQDRMWALTDFGKSALADNSYIEYFLDRHSYDISEVGVNIWSVNEEFVRNTNRPYRDIIFRQLNDRLNDASIEIQKKPASGTAVTHKYCECYRLMGLFVEEEGKSYTNAADFYFQYLFKRINIHAGLQLLVSYRFWGNDKKQQAETINHYYNEIQLYPFHRTELLRLIDELDISGDDVRKAMVTSFKRADDSGIMTPNEAADFVILELSGDVDQSKDLSDKLAKKAVRKIK